MPDVRLWGRLGVEVNISNDEFVKFQNACRNGNGITAESMLIKWFSEGKMKLSGETYFPENEDDDRYELLEEELTVNV